ncbi:uncharacterized protein LOC115878622 [Sitophilus oryzae]|uniref:Uncharacterized protein LOC115878622 n=1 Tax=Sitophilus oryzae TaxID=7048 RepID=A0A6J2XK46_SITOR|nr:uncharacterized protein LOC115878622 [Sitophilus oryzae]
MLYRKRLEEKLQQQRFETLENHYYYIKECIHKAASGVLGTIDNNERKRKRYWWDTDIQDIIEDKRRKYTKYLSTKKIEDKLIYKKAQAKVRRGICQKKNLIWEKECNQLNTYIGGRRSKESWKFIKNVRKRKGKEIISPITPQKWEEYMENLMTENRVEFMDCSDVTTNIRTMGSPIRISMDEVIKDCINGTDVPQEWNETYLSTIYKKGDRTKCENYRGISVTATVSRIYGKILRNRIENEYQEIEAEEQAGFRAGRSTVDHLFTVTHKAYNSVPLVRLWEAMEKTNINVELIKAVKSLYKQTKTRIKVGKKLTTGFNGTKGLKQGCCISPTLFKIYLEQVLKGWKQKCRIVGVPIGDNMLYTLCFADDQVIIAQDYDDINYMTRRHNL